ncbi:hypothetical protein CEP53_003836 [Fusarium sp. AF-6]|nr:hypothetical protein CEP53_003836 [Fusarium sp. AF-6]
MARDGISMGEGRERNWLWAFGSSRRAMFARLVVGRGKMQMQMQMGERIRPGDGYPNRRHSLTHSLTWPSIHPFKTWTSPSRDGHGWFQVAGADGGSGRAKAPLRLAVRHEPASRSERTVAVRTNPWKDVPAKATHWTLGAQRSLSPRPPAKPRL